MGRLVGTWGHGDSLLMGGHGDRLAYKEVGVRRRGARGLDSRTGEEFRAEAGGKAREAADKGGAAWA